MALVDVDDREWRPPAPVPPAHPLGALRLLKTLWSNPLHAWHRAHFEEPMVTTRLPFGQVTVVNDPGAVRRVLVDNAGNYEKDSLQRRVLSAGLRNGLLTVNGEHWRIQRRTLAPMFAVRTVMSFASAMHDAAEALVTRWRRCEGPHVVDVAAEMARLTLHVLERTIFSDGLGRDRDDFRSAMVTYLATIGRIDPLDVLGVSDAIPRVTRLRVRSTVRFFDAAVDTIVAMRRRALVDDPDHAPADLLTLLLQAQDPETGQGMSETEIRANILTFMMAGHETTSNALTWSLFLLSRSQAWHERVVAEARRELDGPVHGLAERLVQTRAVIEEAVRLYPPIVAISRAALEADELAGHIVPAGSMIVVAPYVLHRHRRLWDRPDLYDPARFLERGREAIDRFAYLPFGAGPRVCIGAAFAMQEATLVLATIARHFSFAVAPGHAVRPLHSVTLRPAGGMPMTVAPR